MKGVLTMLYSVSVETYIMPDHRDSCLEIEEFYHSDSFFTAQKWLRGYAKTIPEGYSADITVSFFPDGADPSADTPIRVSTCTLTPDGSVHTLEDDDDDSPEPPPTKCQETEGEPSMFGIIYMPPVECEPEFATTFRQDFTIADRFGANAVRHTFDRAFVEWKHDYRYLTDLVIVLNHKIWEHYESNHLALSRTYDGLWRKASQYALDNLKGDELTYYFNLTD